MALVLKNSKITLPNDIFSPFFHTGANPNPIRFMKAVKVKKFIVLRKHKLLHKATNELVKLMSTLWVSREHTGRVRHALLTDEMGADQHDRCQEAFRRGGWALGGRTSAALEQLLVLRGRLGWSLSFKVLEKLFVTLSKLDFGWRMMIKTDKWRCCGFHPSFSRFFCLLAYLLLCNFYSLMLRLLLCCSCLHCQNELNCTVSL